jgi:alpha-L-fucosidase 2
MINKRMLWSAVLLLSGSVFAVDGEYLSDFDLLWNRTPKAYEESAFLGNGELGTCIWSAREETLHFDIGDTRVYSGKSRAPIGKFILETKGKTSGFSMRLDLQKALASGSIETDAGRIDFQSLASEKHDVVLVEFAVSGGEAIDIEHLALPGASSDGLYAIRKDKNITLKNGNDFSDPDTYKAIMGMKLVQTLEPEDRGSLDGINYRFVPLKGGQGYVLSWVFKKTAPNRYLLVWTTDYEEDVAALSKTAGIPAVKNALAAGSDGIKKEHVASWTEYFSDVAYISIPDKRIEANYWAQIYKMRSAARPGGLPIDLMGPWFRATPWPRIWCNLNIQVTYPVMNQANNYEVARTLFDHMDLKKEHFIKAVDKEFQNDSASVGRGWAPLEGSGFWGEYGNYLWMLYNYSQFLSFFPDETRQMEEYYPMLKRGINFVIHNLTLDDQGIYHVPADVSPEYKTDEGIPEVPDNNYNLGLLKWALAEALHLADQLNDSSPEIATYQKVQKNLVPLQIDPETGIMVGKGYTMDFCHRHFSHLIAFYPLGLVDVNTAEGYELASKSVARWLTRPRWGWGYQGYTYTVATAMYSRLSKPEKALASLNHYLDDFAEANTFYIETGPVIETTMNSASATLEMLVQSFNPDPSFDEIRVFTSIPAAWKEVSVADLRTQGGHLISAQMADGKIVGIHLVAGSDRPVKIRYPSSAKLAVPASAQQSTQGEFSVISASLKKGESLVLGQPLSSEGRQPVKGEAFHFGLNK